MNREQRELKGGDVSIRRHWLGSTVPEGAEGPELAVVEAGGRAEPGEDEPRRPILTFAQAAEATGVSKSTIRRMFDPLEPSDTTFNGPVSPSARP